MVNYHDFSRSFNGGVSIYSVVEVLKLFSEAYEGILARFRRRRIK